MLQQDGHPAFAPRAVLLRSRFSCTTSFRIRQSPEFLPFSDIFDS